MALRPCLGCGRLTSGSRCGTCQVTRGTTAQRGYGGPHQAERERRLATYQPGDICAHGGEPLPYWPLAYARRFLDLPHNGDRSGYLPGLSCRRHNRQDGGRRGNRQRRRTRQWVTSRQW
jgi:hypothetical protein